MRETKQEDRAWTEAVDHYVKGARGRRARRRGTGGQGRYVLASAVVLALLVSPFAVARTGEAIEEGKRNPGSGSATRETQIIGKTKTYVTRQSNVRDDNGGGAIYGCRSGVGREPCIRSNNLKTGRAFEFETDGAEAGHIKTKDPTGKPLTTNATGVATGFNADRIDSLDAARVDFRAASGTAVTDILNFGGLILRATCAAGAKLDVNVDTTVLNSTVHVSWNKDPGNVPFYRQDNDLDPGDNFSMLADNDDSAQGTLVYSSPGGSHVSLTWQAEEGGGFANTVDCLFGGTAMATLP